ncbi:5-(carboxyamino)imidazole ribonucleotide synthase [Leptolyngbya sp. FACHB-261]|nr:5-(carboxyamino)imidazole ribonucleotide synthase [Leptolyngbya sp. FACHB-261]
MLNPAAQKLGLPLRVLASHAQDPAVQVVSESFIGDLSDPILIAQLAQDAQAVTFENEFVDLEQLRPLALPFYPSLDSLAPLLDKYTQRQHLQQHGLPVPRFHNLTSLDADLDKLNDLGWPLVLKARRQGYDGRGTEIVQNPEQLARVWQGWGQVPALVEQFVPFAAELAVMVSRSRSGEIAVHPVVETQQENQVCHRVIAPARVPAEIQQAVETIARDFVLSIDGVGIFGIELFWVPTWNAVLVNEVAPRPHNSGHFSIEACVTSQFEQHLRAVAGLPLGDPALQVPVAVMVNLLGYESAQHDYVTERQQLSQLPGAHVHWYGKSEARPGRKLGHVTLLGDDLDQVLALADRADLIWRRQA